MIYRMIPAVLIAVGFALNGVSSSSAGTLVSYLPYTPSGLSPAYGSPAAQSAISASFSANPGSETALVNSPYDAISISRSTDPGEVILTFTLTANPGYSVTLDKFNFNVGSPSVASPDFPRFLVTSNPSTDGNPGPYGITNLQGSVSQADIAFTPVTLNPGDSILIACQLGVLESPNFIPTSYTIAVGKSLLFNSVHFYGTVESVAAVPEPAGLGLIACALISIVAIRRLRSI